MTSPTEARCPYCLMLVEVADGVAPDHEFPYAVASYGQCEGSGQPTLAGPATPPLVWGADFGTFIEIGVLPSPLPMVERKGWTVTITGVRFTHFTHCQVAARACTCPPTAVSSSSDSTTRAALLKKSARAPARRTTACARTGAMPRSSSVAAPGTGRACLSRRAAPCRDASGSYCAATWTSIPWT